MPAQVAGGVQITATDGGAGNRSTSETTACPSSSRYFGLTGQTGPWNAPSSTRDHTIAPILPARDDAPTTATDLGWNNASRWRTVTSAPCGDERRHDRHAATRAVRRSTRTPSIGEAPATAYMPNGRLFDGRQRSHHGSATHAARHRSAARTMQATRHDAAVARSKVRFYRSHGEYLRESHDIPRQYAKGDESPRRACTAKMANANARALRHYAPVYGNSPQYAVGSRRIRKTGSVHCAALHFNSRRKIAWRPPKNKTVRRPHGRSHRQSIRER